VSDTITLNGIEVELASDAGRAFITDATRAGEGVIDDATLMEKYDLTPEEVQKLANNKAVGRAIRIEREHRLRSGIATRELAAKNYFKAPTVLDEILMDANANPRHRIEAAKEIRQVAAPESPNNPIENTRFVICINLGDGVVEHYDKSVAIDPNDSPPDAQPKLSTRPKLTVLSNDEKFDE
jgi:hypothetical protein